MKGRKFFYLFLICALFALSGQCALAATSGIDDLIRLTGYEPIRTVDDLKDFRDRVNGGANTLKGQLMDDIDLEGAEWTPIGTAIFQFQGEFEGSGKTIRNFKVTDGSGGLFNTIGAGGIVRNLTVERAIISGGTSVGSITGNNNDGKITNCTATGCTVTVGDYGNAGGIVGTNPKGANGGGTIANCTAIECTVTAGVGGKAGGIAGWNREGNITNCTATECTVTAGVNGKAGGILGWYTANSMGSPVSNCTATGCTVRVEEFGIAGGGIGEMNGGEVSGLTVTNGETFGNTAGGAIGSIKLPDEPEDEVQFVVNNIVVTDPVFHLPEDGDRCIGGVVGQVAGEEDAPVDMQNLQVSGIDLTASDSGVVFGIIAGTATGCTTIANALVTDNAIALTGDDNYVGGVVGMTEGDEGATQLLNIVLFGNTITVTGTDCMAGLIAGVLQGAGVADCAAAWGQLVGDALTGFGDIDISAVLRFAANLIGTDQLPMLMALLSEDTYMTVPQGESVTLSVEALPGTKDVAASMFNWASSSPDIVEIAQTADDGMSITFYAKEAGESTVSCAVPLLGVTLTCHVTVTAADDPDPVHSSSSNCNTLGFGIAALALLPLLRKRRK